MKKSQFENEIKKLGLDKWYCPDKEYKNENNYYIDNKSNIYGCYYDIKNKKYILYFKDYEREVSNQIGEYFSEDEAYDKLLEILKTYNK